MPEFASVCDYYKHYKYYHFFAVCFGLSWGLVSYRPRVPIAMSLIFILFFTVVFELMGLVIDLPAHTSSCQGRPYDKTDVILGFVASIFVAVLNNDSYYACTLSYGLGIMTFAVVGTVRKRNSLSCENPSVSHQWSPPKAADRTARRTSYHEDDYDKI